MYHPFCASIDTVILLHSFQLIGTNYSKRSIAGTVQSLPLSESEFGAIYMQRGPSCRFCPFTSHGENKSHKPRFSLLAIAGHISSTCYSCVIMRPERLQVRGMVELMRSPLSKMSPDPATNARGQEKEISVPSTPPPRSPALSNGHRRVSTGKEEGWYGVSYPWVI